MDEQKLNEKIITLIEFLIVYMTLQMFFGI